MLDENDREISLTFAKGLSVLLAFDARDRAITISEIAAKVGLNRAVTRRLVRTLEQLGYLASDRGRYELTPHVLRLSHGFIEGRGIPQLVQPVLRAAADEIGEAVSFAMLDATDAVYVAHAFIPAKFTLNRVSIGSRVPLWPTAAGRAILAFLDADRREALLKTPYFQTYATEAGMDVAGFYALLDGIRATGHAVTDSAYVAGVGSIAVPVRDAARGEAIGAASIIFEHGHYGASELSEMAARLRTCAGNIAAAF